MSTAQHDGAVDGAAGEACALPDRTLRQRVHVCGVPVDALTMTESVTLACELIRTGGPHQHVAINAAKVVAASHDPDLRAIIESCAMANADGQSVVWASKLFGRPLPERVTGIDFMLRMWDVASVSGLRVFLLGSTEASVQKAAAVARRKGVDVVGCRAGFWKSDEEAAVVADVAAADPDLLFVGLPTPRKEEFLHQHLHALGASLAVGVGGSFDVVAGEVSRAPSWMQRLGLEWLHRTRQEPRRLLRRYILSNVEFVLLVGRALVANRRRTP